MLGLIVSFTKWSLFAIAVLVLGHVIEWRNRTISDHIKTTLSHFELEQPQAIRKIERFSKEERARLDRLLSGQAR
jgi:hypothetical protein